MRLWECLITSSTKEDYAKHRNEILQTFCINHKDQTSRWITLLILHSPEKFAFAWTKQHLHFGLSTPSSIEMAKLTVQTSHRKTIIDDLQIGELDLEISVQIDIIEYSLTLEKTKYPGFAVGELYKHLRLRISHHALKILNEEVKKVLNSTHASPLPPCNNELNMSMGIPCAHQIADYVISHWQNSIISGDSIDLSLIKKLPISKGGKLRPKRRMLRVRIARPFR